MKQLLLVDDFEMIREAFKDYLEDEEDFEIAGQANNGTEALEELSKRKYDLLLTDISMPEMDGLSLIKKVNKLYPDLKILVLTMFHDQEVVKKCLKQNIMGYMAKNSEQQKVIKAIRQVLSGQKYWDDEIEALRNLVDKTD